MRLPRPVTVLCQRIFYKIIHIYKILYIFFIKSDIVLIYILNKMRRSYAV